MLDISSSIMFSNIQLDATPHARTFRHAREQVKSIMTVGFSTHEIRTYLRQWAQWWLRTVPSWRRLDLLTEFVDRCFGEYLKVFTETMINQLKQKVQTAVQEQVPARG